MVLRSGAGLCRLVRKRVDAHLSRHLSNGYAFDQLFAVLHLQAKWGERKKEVDAELEAQRAEKDKAKCGCWMAG